MVRGEQVDAVARSESDAGVGAAQRAVVHDCGRDPSGWPGDVAGCLAGCGRAGGDGDLEHLIYAPPIPLARVNEPLLHTTWPPTSTIELLALPTGTAMMPVMPVMPDGAVTFMLKGR